MFKHYHHELLGFIARSIGNRESARNIVQEAFAGAGAADNGTRQRQERSTGRVANLLFNTAKNIVIDPHRRALVSDHDDIDECEIRAVAAANPELVQAALARGILAVAEIGGWALVDHLHAQPVVVHPYATTPGQLMKASLPEESRIELDTATRLEVALYQGRREVR